MYKSIKNNIITSDFFEFLVNNNKIDKNLTIDILIEELDIKRNFNCVNCYNCYDCTNCVNCFDSEHLRYCYKVDNSQYLCNKAFIKNDRYFKTFKTVGTKKEKREEIVL